MPQHHLRVFEAGASVGSVLVALRSDRVWHRALRIAAVLGVLLALPPGEAGAGERKLESLLDSSKPKCGPDPGPHCGGSTLSINGVSRGKHGSDSNVSKVVNLDEVDGCQVAIRIRSSICACPDPGTNDDFGPLKLSESNGAATSPSRASVGMGDSGQCGNQFEDLEMIVSKELSKECSPNGGCGMDGTSTPVLYTSGQLYTNSKVDFVIDDPGYPIRFERQYGSFNLVDGALGWGWSHSLGMHLEYSASSGTGDPSYWKVHGGGKTLLVFPYEKFIDNESSSGTWENVAAFVGSWTAATTTGGYYASNYAHDGNVDKGLKSATFAPYLSLPGQYEVFIRYTSGSDRANNVPVVIHHAQGDTNKTVNMTTNGGSWRSLGTYSFEVGSQGSVTIGTAGTSGLVIADAVRFNHKQSRALNGGATLAYNASTARYQLSYPDGSVDHFSGTSPYRLVSRESTSGEKLELAYDASGNLSTLTTPAGRIVTLSYTSIGGAARITSATSGGQTLAEYSYTSAASDGVDGRLKFVSYPEDGSGYEYSYSSFDSTKKLLSVVADFSGRIVEEHVWGPHPVTGWPVVLSSKSAAEDLSFDYSTYFFKQGGQTGQRKTTVTRRLDAQTTETYEVAWDGRGRVTQQTGSCGNCGESRNLDWLSNAWLLTTKTGAKILRRFDAAGNKVYEAEVTPVEDQVLDGTEEFDGEILDPTRWMAYGDSRAFSTVQAGGGSLHLEIPNSTRDVHAGAVSQYRLQGDFDITLYLNNLDGQLQAARFAFGVSSTQRPRATDSAYVAWETDANQPSQWVRWSTKEANTSVEKSGGAISTGLLRRARLRIQRIGNTFKLYYNDGAAITISSSSTPAMPNEVYIFATVWNWYGFATYNTYWHPLSMDAESITLSSGTAVGTRYDVVPGTERTWQYRNRLLPGVPTQVTRSSRYAGLVRTTTYDFDDPATDLDPGTANSSPTKRLHALTESGYTDSNLDGTPDSTPLTRTTQYAYYTGALGEPGKAGQLKSVDGPLANDTVTYTYDSLGQLLSVENPAGQTVQHGSYDAFGRAGQVTDVNGVVTSLTYSLRGQVLSRTFDASGLNLSSSSAYSDGLLSHSVSPKGVVTVNTYDTYGRVSSTARRSSLLGSDLEKIVYGYNDRGEQTFTEMRDASSTPHYKVSTSHGKSADPSDSAVRDFVEVESPVGSFTTTWSDEAGRPVTRLDPAGHLTLYEYDERGRLQTVTEKDVSDGLSGLVDHVTTYAYDVSGNLLAVTDPEGLVTLYVYDDFARLLEVDSPDSGVTRYSYDIAGRLTSKTQGVGTADAATTAYAYDALGRLLGVDYPGTGRDVEYYYDGQNGSTSSVPCDGYSAALPQPYSTGRLSAVALVLDPQTDERVVTTYEYDARGLLLYERKYVGSSTPHVTAYTHDADGSVESITYPRGLEVQYVYGGSDPGRVTAVAADQGGGAFDIATGISYRPFGDVSGLSYGNGHSLEMVHDEAYRLLGLEVPGVLYRSYGRDSRGNITSVDFSDSTTDKTFLYDEVSRLTSADGPWGSYSYRFDKTGNRLEVNEGTAKTYETLLGTNQITSTDFVGVNSYNHRGNLAIAYSYFPEAGVDFVYGADDRLSTTILFVDYIQIPQPKHLHLPDGRRLEKLLPNLSPVVFHYDRAGNIISETYVTDAVGETENPTIDYIYLGRHRLAAIVRQGSSGGYPVPPTPTPTPTCPSCAKFFGCGSFSAVVI
jgi:YD repeat-containing protein